MKKENKNARTKPALTAQEEKLGLLAHAAAYMERAHVEDYMLLVNRPFKLMWVNFIAGLSRGIGFFLGNIVLGILALYIGYKMLTLAFAHLGGVPWLGDQLKEGVGWMQEIMKQAQAQKGAN